MALKKSELYASLWRSCDELRGGMDASQYKDYLLVDAEIEALEAKLENFEHYKDLEKGKWVKVEGWKDADAAKKEIVEGVRRFRELPANDRPKF